MSDNRWSAGGVSNWQPTDISEQGQEQLRLEVLAHDIPRMPAEFISEIGVAISQYDAERQLASDSKPAVVRANLEGAAEACDALLDIESQLVSLRQALSEAEDLAGEYPKGRLPDDARLSLAMDVARAMEVHLGVHATSTKEGLFESVLAIVLKIATGKPANVVHALGRRALHNLST